MMEFNRLAVRTLSRTLKPLTRLRSLLLLRYDEWPESCDCAELVMAITEASDRIEIVMGRFIALEERAGDSE